MKYGQGQRFGGSPPSPVARAISFHSTTHRPRYASPNRRTQAWADPYDDQMGETNTVTGTARRATDTDIAMVVSILAASHENYVWERWLLPQPDRYAAIERIMNLTTRLIAIPHGEVWLAGDVSAAVWLPPELPEPTPEVARELSTTFTAVFGNRIQALKSVEAAVGELCPRERHWTLGTMGTHPDHQKSGFGTAVLAPMLDRLDRDGMCAALETSAEDNVSFYERFGFTAVAYDDALPHGAPPVWSMWRDPS